MTPLVVRKRVRHRLDIPASSFKTGFGVTHIQVKGKIVRTRFISVEVVVEVEILKTNSRKAVSILVTWI